MINRIGVIVYLALSFLLFFRSFPATGANEITGSLLALFSGPPYKLVVLYHRYALIFSDKTFQLFELKVYDLSLLVVWAGGAFGVMLLKKKFLLIFAVLWLMVGVWNILDFAMSGF
jgi:hypothetical protein